MDDFRIPRPIRQDRPARPVDPGTAQRELSAAPGKRLAQRGKRRLQEPPARGPAARRGPAGPSRTRSRNLRRRGGRAMIQLDVNIMGQPYRLACRDGEEKTLREAVAYLDGKMCALRDSGKVK